LPYKTATGEELQKNSPRHKLAHVTAQLSNGREAMRLAARRNKGFGGMQRSAAAPKGKIKAIALQNSNRRRTSEKLTPP